MTRRVRPGAEFAVDAIARLARQHGAIDLGLGAPDYPPPPEIVDAAIAAVRGHFGYPDPWGWPALRQAVAEASQRDRGLRLDSGTEITITCGATEALYLALAVTTSAGDEVICFDPGYEGFAPAIRACDATARNVRLHRPISPTAPWTFDPAELAAACTARTKAILINSPHNPTGKVFTAAELQVVAELCQKNDLFCISDEVYEHLTFDGRRHVSMMQLNGMRERSFLIGSLSKTFGLPGWRLGYLAASAEATGFVRALNDVTAGGVAFPLQAAAVSALQLPARFFTQLRQDCERRRGLLCQALSEAGLICYVPEGAWYVLADFRSLPFEGSDVDFVNYLVRDIGVAAAPGSAFFSTPERDLIRFCFGKSDALLEGAIERLRRLSKHE
jgi:aminotransferase